MSNFGNSFAQGFSQTFGMGAAMGMRGAEEARFQKMQDADNQKLMEVINQDEQSVQDKVGGFDALSKIRQVTNTSPAARKAITKHTISQLESQGVKPSEPFKDWLSSAKPEEVNAVLDIISEKAATDPDFGQQKFIDTISDPQQFSALLIEAGTQANETLNADTEDTVTTGAKSNAQVKNLTSQISGIDAQIKVLEKRGQAIINGAMAAPNAGKNGQMYISARIKQFDSQINDLKETRKTLDNRLYELQNKTDRPIRARPGDVIFDAEGNQIASVPAKSDVLSPEAEAQKVRIAQAGKSEPMSSELDTPDPESSGITGATGLDPNAFLFITGQGSKLPRDANTRNAAAQEAKTFLNTTGTDLATFQSQYTAYNETLKNNIMRYNQTKIMEGELQGTLENLKPVADAISMGTLRPVNVLKALAGQETLDPEYQQYIFHLQQLKSEVAAYNGALQGRTGNNLNVQDYEEAEKVIKQGLNSKAAGGLETAVQSATEKMGAVLKSNIHTASKAVWELFGVGEQYDRTHKNEGNNAPPTRTNDPSQIPDDDEELINKYLK